MVKSNGTTRRNPTATSCRQQQPTNRHAFPRISDLELQNGKFSLIMPLYPPSPLLFTLITRKSRDVSIPTEMRKVVELCTSPTYALFRLDNLQFIFPNAFSLPPHEIPVCTILPLKRHHYPTIVKRHRIAVVLSSSAPTSSLNFYHKREVSIHNGLLCQ